MRIFCVDPLGNIIGWWLCIELPVIGVHDGRWIYEEA